ncbi:hypothetical protein M0811_14583 [Anaeramoeba ignava]|uniref:Uncharacterized protein n=1 Tax=Anaeramoeba ignava TaxID=1746090 RepID=A0A9Q0RGH8_ANAIG|nr:hypothetical protein M0811_14583 [Anaeramoeba ignava]
MNINSISYQLKNEGIFNNIIHFINKLINLLLNPKSNQNDIIQNHLLNLLEILFSLIQKINFLEETISKILKFSIPLSLITKFNKNLNILSIKIIVQIFIQKEKLRNSIINDIFIFISKEINSSSKINLFFIKEDQIIYPEKSNFTRLIISLLKSIIIIEAKNLKNNSSQSILDFESIQEFNKKITNKITYNIQLILIEMFKQSEEKNIETHQFIFREFLENFIKDLFRLFPTFDWPICENIITKIISEIIILLKSDEKMLK